jgi:hypothetical protein
MAFVTGMGVFSLATYKDVELDPHKVVRRQAKVHGEVRNEVFFNIT